jgi:D-sedoheptulose 7-phosphate isomerase
LSYIHSYIQTVVDLLVQLPEEPIREVTAAMRSAYLDGKQFFAMGNGGSAATASHIANDFQKCIPEVGGRPCRAMSLTDAGPLIMAWANDSDYADVFAEQLRTWVQPGDVVIGISGSGNSENVIRAIQLANAVGAVTVGLSGYDGGRLKDCVRYSLHVPVSNMQQAEDLHMILAHLLFSSLREILKADAGNSGG